MHQILNMNRFLVKEHVGVFKAANNYDIYDPETGKNGHGVPRGRPRVRYETPTVYGFQTEYTLQYSDQNFRWRATDSGYERGCHILVQRTGARRKRGCHRRI